jgi:hypothetical protein
MRGSVAAAALAVVVSASACGGESRTYSVEETKAAFAEEGFGLEIPPEFAGRLPEREEGSILAPPGDDRFVVVVTTDGEAENVWPDYERLQDENSFDARRANVAVFSDDGLPAAHRERVLAALGALPDRGATVMIAGG